MEQDVKMKVCIYARESDSDTTKAPPINNQIDRGKQWVKDNGHELMIVHSDNGFSGGDWNRPAWNQCVKDAKRHMFQIIWIWNQDRLARDTEQFLWFYRNIKAANVNIWEATANDWIDMETLGGRVKHQALAQSAEIFRLVTSDKVKKAYQNKKAKGERWGRKPLKLDKDKIIALRKEGKGYRTIAKEFGCSYQVIRKVLLNTHGGFSSESVTK